ncbi:MAG: translation initiation factor IF-3 [Anaerolineales bacterium]|nr:translation initiation factor IF-3 [Anaerolineales bacterium]
MSAKRNPQGQSTSAKRNRINEDIRAKEVRLIDEKGQQVGIVPFRDALEAAQARDLDLVEVAPNANPPVCRLMDYGKFLYEQAKREKKARKAQKTEVKEIRLRPKIGEHDVAFKVRDARRFLNDGLKVKVRVSFRGREITYPEIGRELLKRIAQELEDVSTIEQSPRMEGRSLLMILSPNK